MFSVVTITYNREDLLRIAVTSVLSQTHPDFEHIIIDDGSSDATETMLSGFNDKRIKYISTPHSGHLTKLRNMGLDLAAGNIVAFLDSDDFWEPDYLQKLSEIYATGNANSVVSNAFVLSSGVKTQVFEKNTGFSIKKNLLREKLISDDFVIYPSAFSFRNSLPQMRFNELLIKGENDLFIRILALGGTYINMKPLLNIVKHEANSSSDPTFFIQTYSEEFETLKYLRKHKRISSLLCHKATSRYLYKLGYDFSRLGDKMESRKHYLKAFFSFPLNVKALTKFFLALTK